ncbi:Glyoxalase-like domain protein [compost metagenome]
MDILGIDNVIMSVSQLDSALAHYVGGLGFRLKFRMEAKGMALLDIGKETPGLILREEPGCKNISDSHAPKLWVEVRDAVQMAKELESRGIALLAPPLQIGTGWVVEVADEWGNIIGFTDYLLRPELGRPISE